MPPKFILMRNNTTGGRSVARGNGRKASATGRRQEGRAQQGKPAGRSRYSAGEGSVRSSAEESPAKRGHGRTGLGRRTTGRFGRTAEAPKPQPVKVKSAEDGVRLNKFIANSGICSRREADDYIAAGLVSVNGKVVTELGSKVFPADDVRFNGERIKGEEKVYILMNKPKDFVTTVSDPHADKTVVSLVSGKCKERVYPVGRLDKATTGVLLLTNDGDLAEKLTHPSFEKKKIYHVHLDKNFKQTDLSELMHGITLEDGFIQADAISYVDEDKTQVGVEIHSGRNRIIRRMFEHLGYKVKKLDRVYFAGLTKKNLRRGQWRFLTEQEVAMLQMGSYE